MYLHLQDYLRPATVEACLDGLSQERSAALAGGTYINATGHEHLQRVVDLQALPLSGIETSAAGVRIGALATLSEVVAASLPGGLEALTQAALAERNGAIRNVSTVGGRICRDTADARLLTALLALDAEVEVSVRGAADERVSIETFRRSQWQRQRRGSYLVTALHLPVREGRSAYRDFSMTAVDTPYADAAVFVGSGADAATVRVAVGALGATAEGVVRATVAEEHLSGDRDEGWQDALRAALEPTLPNYTTPRASGDYRRDVATTLVLRLASALSSEEVPV